MTPAARPSDPAKKRLLASLTCSRRAGVKSRGEAEKHASLLRASSARLSQVQPVEGSVKSPTHAIINARLHTAGTPK